MKKSILFIWGLLFIIACKDKTDISKETPSVKREVKSKIKDSLTKTHPQIPFDNYKVDYKKNNAKAKIDFNSNPIAKKYRTVILEKYLSGDINFSGTYILITWGCGIACISGVIVNVKDGKVYDLPTDGEWGGIGNLYHANKSSSLLVTSLSSMPVSEGIEAIEKYWNWNESNKKFEFIKTLEIPMDKSFNE